MKTKRKHTPHSGDFKSIPAEERFWAKVRKTDSCWLWTASVNKQGYGKFNPTRSPQWGAHRFSWFLHHGPIPEGMWVLHKCDITPCVNPDHLFLGTALENNHDMIRKGRQRYPAGLECAHSKLTAADIQQIRERIPKEPLSAIAKDYGVNPVSIFNVKHRITYAEVE